VDADEAIELLASRSAIATFAESLADALPHPGLVSVPLIDGPAVRTRLVWRPEDDNRDIEHLLDIARDMYGGEAAASHRMWALRARCGGPASLYRAGGGLPGMS
jgi:hypothetical protein